MFLEQVNGEVDRHSIRCKTLRIVHCGLSYKSKVLEKYMDASSVNFFLT